MIQASSQCRHEHRERSHGARRASLEDAGKDLQHQDGLPGPQKQHVSRCDRQRVQVFAEREQEHGCRRQAEAPSPRNFGQPEQGHPEHDLKAFQRG